ncbi:uncharacterized protein TNCV_3187471 [Trichonephila clavipes]|nr:uncharacterized protein TNCV_3187471 [Trichonephila clavipes]
MLSEGAEFVVGNIEKLFKEARQNTRVKHEKGVKYYNKRRLDVSIRVNNFVLVEKHPFSSTTRKVVAKFKPKLEDPYTVLSARNNNEVIWKAGRRTTVNTGQVRIYHQRKIDEGVIVVESSFSNRSEYQSSILEENRPILDHSQGFRSSESGKRRGDQRKNTSLTGNQDEESFHPSPRDWKESKLENQAERRTKDCCRHPLLSPRHRRKELENQKSRFIKEDQALTKFDPELTSRKKLVLELQEEQCKSWRDQSGTEENHLEGQALTINVDSPNNKVTNCRTHVGAEDPGLIFLDTFDNPDSKIARSLKIVQRAEGQHRLKYILEISRKEEKSFSQLLKFFYAALHLVLNVVLRR